MDRDDAEEYTQALGQVVSGGWRQIALGERLGVPQVLGMSTREWVEGRLGGYVKLSAPERKIAVAELTTGEDPLPNVKAAEILGVTEGTVRNDRRSQNYEPEQKPPPEPQVEPEHEPQRSQNYEPELTHDEQLGLVEDLDDQGRLAKARLVRAYTQALHHVTKELLPLDQGAVATVLEEPMRSQALEFARQMEDWAIRFQRSLQPLRVVKGDHQ